jgi:hypothetical protein
MGNKKNIDRLFQEKFKNFEATPNDAMWDTIQAKLDENDSRKKRFPLWVLFSGVAATVMIFVALSVSFLSEDESIKKIVLAPEVESSINKEKGVSDGKNAILIVNQNLEKMIDSGLKNEQNITRVDVIDLSKESIGLTDTSLKYQNISASTTIKIKKTNKNLSNKNSNMLLFSKEGLLERKASLIQNNLDEIDYKKELVSGSGNKSLKSVKNQNNAIVNNDKPNVQEIAIGTSGFSEKNNEIVGGFEQKISKFGDDITRGSSGLANEVLQHVSLRNSPNVNNGLNFTKREDIVAADGIVTGLEVISSLGNLIPGEESLVEEECVDEECVDEEIEKPIEKTIEDAIVELEEEQDDEEDKEEEVDFNKWRIAPNIAPVYYNTLSSGSPIDSELSGNKKKGKINMSYGLGVGYAVSKRLTLRTGINKVSLGFDTEDVAVSTNQETVSSVRSMRNINLSPAVVSLNISSSENLSLAQIPSSFSSLYNSSLNQRFGYLEVPLELSYKISDKKMKIDVIAGVSTFFLNENEIYTVTNGIETHVGEANNLNKMSYSTNVGLGFNYNISKAFNFNFEPTFKYQLNAFSNDSGNFKPYILGVYTGFSFKF